MPSDIIPEYMFTKNVKFMQKTVVLHPDDDRILMMRRWPGDRSRANSWDFPGGNVQYPELHMDSLSREIKEESGLEVQDIRPVMISTNYDKIKDIYYLFIGYRSRALNDVVILSHEHTEYKWVTKEEFMTYESAGFLQKLVELI